MHRALHRLLFGSAAALLAAAVVAVPGSPALAADPALRLHFTDLAVVENAPKLAPLYAWIDVPEQPNGAPTVVAKLTVSVDTADVEDIVTVQQIDDLEVGEQQSCGRTGTVLSCTMTGPFELEPGPNLMVLLGLEVAAKAGAAQDETGKLAFSARLDDAPAVSAESKVTIGEGVDLAGVINTPVTVAPGSSVAADVQVSNAGTKPVKSTVLVLLGWDPTLTEGGFSNCRYGFLTVCTFDDELAVGTTYELAKPMLLKIPADAAGGSRASALGSWHTASDFAELIDMAAQFDGDLLGPKGTGPAVGLKAVPVKAARSRAAGNQVDTKPDNNLLLSEFVVSGRRPDMAAVGATVKGDPGDQVPARIGFRNNGPGTLYHWTFNNNDPGTHVTVPAGLVAVKVDERCFPVEFEPGTEPEDFPEDLGGASEYLCMLEDGKTKAKGSALFDFGFQVREDPSGEAGKVSINEELFVDSDPIDRDAGNDTAKLVLEVSGGGGGGLPVTGANAGLIGAGGALLLLAGAVGLLLFRRRRVRFTA
jgi:LPXTG-motif cell wall-anchored protein